MKFQIGFDDRDRQEVLGCWHKILAGNRWTQGDYVKRFEEEWSRQSGLRSVAFSSWTGGAIAALVTLGLKGKRIIVPGNTMVAVPMVCELMGNEVVYGECNRQDLCLSYDWLKRQKPDSYDAVFLVHVGGHVAFDVERIASLCFANKKILIEDCAHAHGASANGKASGSFGDAGIFSFYATKTITTGEGGMLVTRHGGVEKEARLFRNYGKDDSAAVVRQEGLNLRMSEFTAALGYVQAKRLPEIVGWKNELARKLDVRFDRRVILPSGWVSGYYKYVVFEEISESTGKVFDTPSYRLMGRKGVWLKDVEWICRSHWCVPTYYNRGRKA